MQAALTIVCLGAAGLVVQSLVNVLRVEPGFRPAQVLTLDIGLSPGRYPTRDYRAAFARKTLERLQSVPGVATAAVSNRLPLHGISVNSILAVEGTERSPIPMQERPLADIRSVSSSYFSTLGVPLLDGRLFTDDSTRPVAVISHAMATRAWPGQTPLGKRFRLSAQPDQLVEVVGIVGDTRNMGLESAAPLTIYLPYTQGFLNEMSFALKTTVDPASATASVRTAITDIDRDVPIRAVRTMDGVVRDSVAGRSFQATLLMLFAAIAVALAGVGVFGVVSYSVAQRSRELGIRAAFGATRQTLLRMVLGDAFRYVAAGVIVGLPLAVAAGYALRDALFGIGPQNPGVLVAACGLVVLVAAAAAYVPARRATRIDPVATLRME